MNIKFLQLHLAQTQKALLKARGNNYSDQEKKTYQNSLISLFESINKEVSCITLADDPTVFETKRCLDFILKSLEFLDSSILNLIPYEIIECLKVALEDWILPDENYIIVTSLVNGKDDFSLDTNLISNRTRIYDLIKHKYGIDFERKLIQINVPKSLSRDYLVSVVLYHELGHFIDEKNNITDAIARTLNFRLLNDALTSDQIDELKQFFPYINSGDYSEDLLKWHFGEYFCDLFGAQYIGESSNRFLLYITENSVNYSWSHPSSVNREKVVNDFLESKPNIVVDLINEALGIILKKNLRIFYEKVSKNDFINFLPPVIESPKQLHGIFITGWELWEDDWEGFRTNMKMHQTPNPDKIYLIINNLIEKSIGNYTVNKKWRESISIL